MARSRGLAQPRAPQPRPVGAARYRCRPCREGRPGRGAARWPGGCVHRHLAGGCSRPGAITAGTPAGAQVRRVRPGSMIGVPARAAVRRAWIEIGAGTLIGAQVTLSRGHGARATIWATGRCCGSATGCVIGRGSHIVAHHSIVIGDDVLHRPLRLHHRPEPRLRRPGRADRPAVAEQHRGVHRRGKLARRRGDRAARRVDRPERGGRGRLGGPRRRCPTAAWSPAFPRGWSANT